MVNNLMMPTYEELAELSNGDLMKCVTLSAKRLNTASAHGENTISKTQIHQAYEGERLKRLKLVQKRLADYC